MPKRKSKQNKYRVNWYRVLRLTEECCTDKTFGTFNYELFGQEVIRLMNNFKE